jgi:hypothetical protein
MNASGWRLVALEWERESESTEPEPAESARVEEVPYGVQISGDGFHLIESPAEMRVLMTAVNLIVDDAPLSGVADELNRQGFRTRTGAKWTPTAVFNLLPRMIETGPRIFTNDEWVERRKRLTRD